MVREVGTVNAIAVNSDVDYPAGSTVAQQVIVELVRADCTTVKY